MTGCPSSCRDPGALAVPTCPDCQGPVLERGRGWCPRPVVLTGALTAFPALLPFLLLPCALQKQPWGRAVVVAGGG